MENITLGKMMIFTAAQAFVQLNSALSLLILKENKNEQINLK